MMKIIKIDIQTYKMNRMYLDNLAEIKIMKATSERESERERKPQIQNCIIQKYGNSHNNELGYRVSYIIIELGQLHTSTFLYKYLGAP